ncbi:MAG: 4-alpha-glucanotransferase [Gemmatimonadota bacterium]
MSAVVRSAIEPLIREFGIQSSYQAASGETVHASAESMLAVLGALGADTAGDLDTIVRRELERAWSRVIEPVVVAWDGALNDVILRLPASAARRTIRYELRLEDGDVVHGTIPPSARRVRGTARFGRSKRVELAASIPKHVRAGYHELAVKAGDAEVTALLISAPMRCYSGDRPREWGVFAPLYSIRETRAEPIGNFNDLESLMRWIGELGGDLVATLPISAGFIDEFSPYSPASRLFWNELYLSNGNVDGGSDGLVDYQAVAQAQRAALAPVARQFFAGDGADSERFREFIRLYPDAEDYARFRAAREQQEAAFEYHLYAQLLCHEQLSSVAENSRAGGVRLYLDMPLGVHPQGYDLCRNPALFVTGASAGAPPDPFFTRGQNWGFPPINPVRMREQRHAYWRKVLQTQLRYAGMLRLDHVMALHRLYFVPQGFDARQGVYVRYPTQELYAVLTLESSRHQAVIVGEDLGTVPAEVRKSMAQHGVKRMFVVQFEARNDATQPIDDVPRDAVASLNTHDMPSFRTYWEGGDAELRHEIGLIDAAGVRAARAERLSITSALSRLLGARSRLPAETARTALLEFLARSPADITLINLEDLWLESEPQNVPGTGQERPNWRRRSRYTLEEIRAQPEIRNLLELVEATRRVPEEPHE